MAELKATFSSLSVICIFDVSKPVLVSGDASPVGLEAVLINGPASSLLFHNFNTNAKRLLSN